MIKTVKKKIWTLKVYFKEKDPFSGEIENEERILDLNFTEKKTAEKKKKEIQKGDSILSNHLITKLDIVQRYKYNYIKENKK